MRKFILVFIFCVLLSSNTTLACNGDYGTCDSDNVEPITLSECVKYDIALWQEGQISYQACLVSIAVDCGLYDVADFVGRF